MIDTPSVAVSRTSVNQTAPARPLYARITGSLVCVTGATRQMRAHLAALLRPFLVGSGPETGQRVVDIAIHLEPAPALSSWRIYVNGDFFTLTFDSATLIPYIEWLVISRAIERSTTYVTFHAASLAWRRRAVILIAPSGSGKTTLTAGLASRGWKTLADDLTVVDVATRAAHPFRRCFHADPFTRSVIETALPTHTPVTALSDYIRPIRWAPESCAPTWVVMVRRDPAEPASIAPVTRAQAAGALFTSAIRNGLSRSEVARLSASLASMVTGCWTLNNSDLGATLDALDQALRSTMGAL